MPEISTFTATPCLSLWNTPKPQTSQDGAWLPAVGVSLIKRAQPGNKYDWGNPYRLFTTFFMVSEPSIGQYSQF